MARRIVLTVLLLIAAVLGVVAVPLGVLTAAQENRSFQQDTVSAAVTLANVAEERIGDSSSARALDKSISQFERAGDLVSVFDSADRRIAGTAVAPAVSPDQLARTRADALAAVYPAGDRVLAVAPVVPDSGKGTIGAVVLARPAAPVRHRVTVLWTLIAAVATAGLLAAALIAVGLARWVSRPLDALERAAQQLGDGALSARSPAGQGPPEVRRLAANFNRMAARLEALVHGHQVTMADVSHQLRTPLAALRLRLDLLAQDSDERVAAELAGAQEEITRLTRLVNGLLAVARAENITAAPVQVAVDAVIRDRVAAWRPAAEERDVTLETDDLQPVGARAGAGHLEQILDNLLANALDAVGAGDIIRISAAAAGSRARIVVADTGPGMTAQQRRLAFRRFAVSTSGGTGLGLAIVDRLVVSDGGSATLSDTPGGGLTVTIELPAAPRDRGQRRAAPGGRSGGAPRSPDSPVRGLGGPARSPDSPARGLGGPAHGGGGLTRGSGTPAPPVTLREDHLLGNHPEG
jgi:signal transduction histidine kinase